MLITKDTQQIDDPNTFGELLREYCFVGGYGCYQTFDLKSEFVLVDKNSTLGKSLLAILGVSEERLNSTDEWTRGFAEDIYRRAYMFSNGIVHVAWYWDGDGELVFVEGDKIAINSDCKCDYNWKWHDKA